MNMSVMDHSLHSAVRARSLKVPVIQVLTASAAEMTKENSM